MCCPSHIPQSPCPALHLLLGQPQPCHIPVLCVVLGTAAVCAVGSCCNVTQVFAQKKKKKAGSFSSHHIFSFFHSALIIAAGLHHCSRAPNQVWLYDPSAAGLEHGQPPGHHLPLPCSFWAPLGMLTCTQSSTACRDTWHSPGFGCSQTENHNRSTLRERSTAC